MALKSAGRYTPFVQTPPYSPGLNPVEHRWGDLCERPIQNRIFSSIDMARM